MSLCGDKQSSLLFQSKDYRFNSLIELVPGEKKFEKNKLVFGQEGGGVETILQLDFINEKETGRMPAG
jgi:hypothetical protein